MTMTWGAGVQNTPKIDDIISEQPLSKPNRRISEIIDCIYIHGDVKHTKKINYTFKIHL
jgi:hypothetical protein